jgi:CRP-like cAMP-binding protein
MIDLFAQAGLQPLALSRLGELLIDRAFRAGDSLETEGQLTSSLFIVVEGALDVFSGDQQIATLTAGDTYGEKSLLEPSAAPATLRAQTDGRALVFDGAAYDQFAKEFPESAFSLQALLARRVLRELKKAQTNLRLLFETFKAS